MGDAESIEIGTEGETLPVEEILTGRAFLTGKSGSGKSNSASVVAEELLSMGLPLVIVDTDGEYWGLKEQYEVLHVGADDECDLQVGPEHAEKLAGLALEENVPIILDVSGYLELDTAEALIREVARHLFAKEKKLKKPFLLVVEEIHEYLPEKSGMSEVGEMLIRVAKRGRKRGLGLMGLSQRPADVKKDFITQCDWLVWHRLTWENDLKVVRRVLGTEYADDIQGLDDGEAFLQADFLDVDVQQIQWRRKQTFDAGATPGLGEFERPDLKDVGEDLVGELEEISEQEERRQDRIAQLESELDARESRIRELEEELENAQDMRDLATQMAEGLQATGSGDVAQERVDKLVQEKNRLESAVEERERRIEELESRVADLEGYEERVEQLDSLDLDEAEEAVFRLSEALGIEPDGDVEKWREKYQREKEKREVLEADRRAPETDILDHPAVQRALERLKRPLRDLDEKQLKMLEYWRFYGTGSLADAYFHAGGSRTSGTKSEKSKLLREAGIVRKEKQGEYRYAIDDYVEDEFGDNPQIGDDDLEALIAEVETVLDDQLDVVE